MTTALVHVPIAQSESDPQPKAESNDKVAPETTFAAFYRHVVTRFAARKTTTMQGAIVWSAHVLDHVLMDGAWPVLLAAAKRIGVELDSPSAAELVLDRVDRVLSVGIRIHYGSVEAAADAFMSVLTAIDSAIALGFRPGMTLSTEAWRTLRTGNDLLARREIGGQAAVPLGARATLWQTPVYQFMVECLRAAREYAEEIDREQRSLRERTSIRYEGKVIRFTRIYRGVEPRRAYLEVPREDLRESDVPLVEAKEMIAKERSRIGMLTSLPIDPAVFQTVDVSEIDDPALAWLRSQLLLLALGVPGRQYLESAEYVDGLRALKAADAESLVDGAVERIRSLGFPDDPSLCGVLRQKLTELRAWLALEAEVLTIAVERDIMIRFDVDEVIVTPDQALEAAVGEDPRFQPGATTLSTEEFTRLLAQAVVQLRWDTFRSGTIGRIIDAEVIPLEAIFEGVGRMPIGPERDAAIGLLLRTKRLSGEQIGTLFALGDIEANLENVVEYLKDVPQKTIDELVRGIVNARFRQGYDQQMSDQELGRLLQVIVRVSPEVMAWLLEPPRRPLMAFVVSVVLWASDVGFTKANAIELRKRFDDVTWRWLVLGALAEGRRLERSKARREGGEPSEPLVAWEKLPSSEEAIGDWNDLVTLLASSDAAANAVAMHTEEEALRWLYAGKRGIESFIAQWRADRDLFDVRH